MSGWIKMHRKLLDNPIVCKDSDHLAVWTYLLLNATHKEYPAVFGKGKIMLQPGQLITGRKAISDRLRVSESKIQRILYCFESEHQIEQQTSNKNRLVTVLSWSEYQDSEQQDELEMNNKRTTNEQQMNTNKKLRTKEVKNEIKDIKEHSQDTVDLTNHLISWIHSNNPSAKIPTSLEKWNDEMERIERLDKYDYMQIRSVIDWCQQDSFWKSNILSVAKLREKMGTLIMQMQRPKGGSNGKISSFERLQQMHKEEITREASGHY